MKRERLYFLVKQYRDGDIADKELKELKKYLESENSDELLSAVFVELDEKEALLPPKELEGTALFEKINKAIDNSARRKDNKQVKLLFYVKVAAAVLLMIGGTLMIWKVSSPLALPADEVFVGLQESIVPGNNKARVVLEDGREIDLESLPNDTVLWMEGYALVKGKKGEVSYKMDAGTSTKNERYNTIIVPKGGEYKLNLPDGSEVWMNASSSLKYPLYFGSESREVELQGEAYFSVKRKKVGAKNLPFIVHSGTQKLEVLGTEFNVNTYADAIRTTLVEGAVRLSFGNAEMKELKPNQQAVFNDSTQELNIQTVRAYYTTAWKDGVFAFDNAELEEVMGSIARWYDVSFDYEKDKPKIRFTGMISRYEDIAKLLKAIEMTNSVKFKIKERRIMVQAL